MKIKTTGNRGGEKEANVKEIEVLQGEHSIKITEDASDIKINIDGAEYKIQEGPDGVLFLSKDIGRTLLKMYSDIPNEINVADKAGVYEERIMVENNFREVAFEKVSVLTRECIKNMNEAAGLGANDEEIEKAFHQVAPKFGDLNSQFITIVVQQALLSMVKNRKGGDGDAV